MHPRPMELQVFYEQRGFVMLAQLNLAVVGQRALEADEESRKRLPGLAMPWEAPESM